MEYFHWTLRILALVSQIASHANHAKELRHDCHMFSGFKYLQISSNDSNAFEKFMAPPCSAWKYWCHRKSSFSCVCVKHRCRCKPSMTTCNTSKGPRLHSSAVANESTDVWRGYAVWSTARTCEPFYFTGNGMRLSQEPPISHFM